MPTPSRLLCFRVALAVASLVVALGVGEIAVRILDAAPKIKSLNVNDEQCVYQRSNNPLLGFELKPDFECESPDFIATYERTNSHGQRDVERPQAKPANTTRVLLLGDSVVEGYGLPESSTISSQLQSVYDQNTGAGSVEVLNFGVSAYCTRAEVELLESKALLFEPDVVVLVFVENDFDDFNREAFPLAENTNRPKSAEWCFKHLHLFRLASWQLNLFQFRQTSDPAKWNSDAIGNNNVATGFKRFRELATKQKFQPVVAIWPRFEDNQIVDMHPVAESEQLVVEALAGRYDLPTVRLSSDFRQAAAEQTNHRSPRLLFSQGDSLHPSPEGARVAAQAIYKSLVNQSAKVPNSPFDANEIDAAAQQLLQSKPNYARVYDRLGNQLLKSGDYVAAIKQYELAIAEDELHAGPHNNLGIAIERVGGTDSQLRAIEHFKRAIELEPDFAHAHLNLGNALATSAPATAQQHFIRAVQLKPDFVAAHFSLSRHLYRQNRPTAAEAGLGQVLKLAPNHEQGLLLLATIQTKQQRYQDAKASFKRLLAVEPQHVEALNNLAAICVAMGDTEAAIKHLRAAVAAAPDDARTRKNLDRILSETTQ